MAQAYRSGQHVSWQWGNGTADGTVEKIAHETIEIQSHGQTIVRHGTDDNPAIIIMQDDKTKVLKLASELQ